MKGEQGVQARAKEAAGKVMPDKAGHFGPYGGRYVAETLMPALLDLEKAYEEIRHSADFKRELADLLANYAGRPTPLFHARRLTAEFGGAQVYLKREDLTHTGGPQDKQHRRPGASCPAYGEKKTHRQTGAGQHGVATATVACLAWTAGSLWASRTSVVRRPTCNAWDSLVPKWFRSAPGPGP